MRLGRTMIGGTHNPDYGLEKHGLENVGHVYWTCVPPVLYEQAIRARVGMISFRGPLVVRTGDYTGRSPGDRFVVDEESSREKIWWGESNRPFSEEKFNTIFLRLSAYLQGKDVYVQDCYAGRDPAYRISVRVITEDAWHSLFARNMFIRMNDEEELKSFVPQFTVINVPGFRASPAYDGTASEAFILVNLAKKMIKLSGRDDIEITFTGLRPGEKLYEELLIDESDMHTEYESITVAAPTHYDISQLNEDITQLCNAKEKLAILKKIVPEFNHKK